VTIAVTGGTGFVGQALLDAAAEQGQGLRALARKPQAPRAGVEWVAGDLGDAAALAALVKGAEAVIHVAGLTTAPDAAGFEAGNVAGTLNLVEAALAAGVPRFVLVSSLSAREPELSLYGKSKAKAEQVVKASGLDWTIVRPPAVYGPRDDGMFELFRAARWGVVPMPAEGKASLIHAEDLARLLLALVPGGEAVTHRTFEPDDGKSSGWAHYDLARAIGWAVGRRPWVLGLSPRLMGWAARGDMLLRGARAKLTLDRVGYMNHPDWVASPEAQVPGTLWHPQVETREGLRATALWYREKGWL
jgi:nucleoside-diphosphate-sugar epimerase